jgi:CheY-like chemotaxis protein
LSSQCIAFLGELRPHFLSSSTVTINDSVQLNATLCMCCFGYMSDPGIKLVVADVNMPNMDGLTMVEKIRGELGNARVNLIMLTTESSPNMKERGKAAGVKGWIVKPFKGTAVLETFKKLVA